MSGPRRGDECEAAGGAIHGFATVAFCQVRDDHDRGLTSLGKLGQRGQQATYFSILMGVRLAQECRDWIDNYQPDIADLVERCFQNGKICEGEWREPSVRLPDGGEHVD